MMLAIAAEYSLDHCLFDYSTAFLKADMEEEVYVRMAPGNEEFDEDEDQMKMRLLRSFYGIYQHPSDK